MLDDNLVCGIDNRDCVSFVIAVAGVEAEKKAMVDCMEGTRISYLTKTMFTNNTSGTRGVTFQKSAGKWMASITFQKKTYYLGCYVDINKAIMARKIAEEELWTPVLEKYLGFFESENERKEKLNQYIKEKITERTQSMGKC